MLGKSPHVAGAGLLIVLGGTLAGAVIGVPGVLVTAAGAACAVLATASVVLFSLLAAGRLSTLTYEHREAIQQLANRLRTKLGAGNPSAIAHPTASWYNRTITL